MNLSLVKHETEEESGGNSGQEGVANVEGPAYFCLEVCSLASIILGPTLWHPLIRTYNYFGSKSF